MFTIFGFYKFKKINNLKKNQKILNNFLVNKNIYGSIIISEEGLNGSMSGKNVKLPCVFSKKQQNTTTLATSKGLVET